MDKIKRTKELVKKLNEHRDAYYNKSRPIISDAEYDKLFDELKSLEIETGLVMSNSPTHTVGYKVKSKLEKVRHEYPMLSLDKTKSVDDLNKFVGDKDAIVMLKLDGLTVAVTYENGIMVKAETRGNGSEGELITSNAKTFVNLPTTIPYKNKLVVFGEAIITYDDFKTINNKLSEEEKYKNPRNLVSGSVRQLDNKICSERNVKFIAWRLVEGSDSNDFYDRLLELNNYGFDIVPATFYDNKKIEQILEEAHQVSWDKKLPIDGCVISYRDIPNIGTSQSKELVKTFKTWDDFSAAGFGNYDFSQLEGFGAVLNSNIHTWFDTMYKEDQIDQLARNITFTENENSISTEILKGKTFVITGSLEHYKNREELKSVIERNGGKVSGSISKNTFALINNNINSTSSKNKKANSLGVQIISEEDFIQLISK